MQVIKTFGIHDIFREAINSCTDLNHSEFPLLSKNKSSQLSILTSFGSREKSCSGLIGLVDLNWILSMDTGHSVVLFVIVGGTVNCCFVCKLL